MNILALLMAQASFLLANQEALVNREIFQPQEIRPLPGQLDRVPMFNSNSPEKVQSEGILLSTFPPQGKQFPAAHLNFAFSGRFNIFAHHVARVKSPQDPQTLYLGLLLKNPSAQPAKVLILRAVSHLTTNAPFINLPAKQEDRRNRVYAGPGSRTAGDVVRGESSLAFPTKVDLQPGETKVLASLPIPASALNGRTTLMRLWTNGSVYAASLALFARRPPGGQERSPTTAEWQAVLQQGDLVKPRDRSPTPPGQSGGTFIYGRVAGVSQGSQWQSTLNDGGSSVLTIPTPGQAFSYPIASLNTGTLGTNQIQSAPMLVRYPDTAYRSHGNYGVEYDLTLPLQNRSEQTQRVSLLFQTPLKENKLAQSGLRFLQPPDRPVFFRGTVRLQYQDDQGKKQIRYIHLVQQRGQRGQPLVTLTLPPGGQRSVSFNLVYPADATPPQVLTIQTAANSPVGSTPLSAPHLRFQANH